MVFFTYKKKCIYFTLYIFLIIKLSNHIYYKFVFFIIIYLFIYFYYKTAFSYVYDQIYIFGVR